MRKLSVLVLGIIFGLISCSDSLETRLREKLGPTVKVIGVGEIEYDLRYVYHRAFTKSEMLEKEKNRKNSGLDAHLSNEIYASTDDDQIFDAYYTYQTYIDPTTGEVTLAKIDRNNNEVYLVK